MPISTDGGLGAALVGDKIVINHRHVAVTKFLGEGGFSFVYLVKELSDMAVGQSLNNTVHGGEAQRSGSAGGGADKNSRSGSGSGATTSNSSSKRPGGSIGNGTERKEMMVLKVTSILSRQQRDIAEKEAKLLSRLSHPSIIKMYDTCYRTATASASGRSRKKDDEASKQKERPQHLILMEYCEGGHALDVCARMAANGERFDLSSLIIAFGQICNAVSYLHAQRPPIVHRDLKPANFLIKNGAYKLCDFGSAVFGHVDLKTSQARAEAEEVIQKTTTQMFRAPEMVDLYMAKKLTQATDVWALGCCLYSLAFLQNCFEEGSNLAILSRKYKIPDDNPYGEGLVELIDRMLTVDSKARADMTEVILCLSAVYSGRPLPPRKERSSKPKKDESSAEPNKEKKKKSERVGTFRTDGQGIYQDPDGIEPVDLKKPKEAKKLDPNSAAARRLNAVGGDANFASFHNQFDQFKAKEEAAEVNQELAFSTTENPFASFENKAGSGDIDAPDVFSSFDDTGAGLSSDADVLNAFNASQNWGAIILDKNDEGFGSFEPDEGEGIEVDENGNTNSDLADVKDGRPTVRRNRSVSTKRPRRKTPSRVPDDHDDIAEAVKSLSIGDDEDDDQADIGDDDAALEGRIRRNRGRVRRTQSNSLNDMARRPRARGDAAIRRTVSSRLPSANKTPERRRARRSEAQPISEE